MTWKRHGEFANWLICLTIPLSATSCFKGPKFFTQESQSANISLVIDESSGTASGKVSATSTATQVIAVEGADKDIDGSAVIMPPGTLATDSIIQVRPGAGLASDGTSAELDLTTAGGMSSASSTVNVSSSASQNAQNAYTLQIPLSGGTSLALADQYDLLIVLFKVQDFSQGGIYVLGVLPRSAITIAGGKASFETKFFGSFQLAYTEKKVESAKTKTVTSKILTKSEETKLPAIEWAAVEASYSASSKKLTASSSAKGSAISMCMVRVDESKSAPFDLIFASRDINLIEYAISGFDGKQLSVQLSCIDEHGRSTISGWSNTFTVTPANAPPEWLDSVVTATVAEDSAFSMTVGAKDVDKDTISYALDKPNMSCDDQGWNPNIEIVATTGVVSGTPTNSSVGSCTIKVIAVSLKDSIAKTITVTVSNTGDDPIWSSLIGDFTIVSGASIAKTASASDPDIGDLLSYSFDLGAMTCDEATTWLSALSINSTTGTITGQPTKSATCTMVVKATSGGTTLTQTSNVTVSHATATKIVFSVQPQHSTGTAYAITPNVQVEARDQYENLASSFAGNITLGIDTSSLSGTTTLAAVSGAVTFGSIQVAATGTMYTLSASATGLATAYSNSFNVGGTSVVCTWLGTTSTAWSTISNWNCGKVPTAADTIIIEPYSANQPIVSVNQSIAGFAIGKGGGSITVNSGKSLTCSDGATACYIKSEVQFKAGSAGCTACTFALANSTFISKATLTLHDNVTVSGNASFTLNVNSGGQLKTQAQSANAADWPLITASGTQSGLWVTGTVGSWATVDIDGLRIENINNNVGDLAINFSSYYHINRFDRVSINHFSSNMGYGYIRVNGCNNSSLADVADRTWDNLTFVGAASMNIDATGCGAGAAIVVNGGGNGFGEGAEIDPDNIINWPTTVKTCEWLASGVSAAYLDSSNWTNCGGTSPGTNDWIKIPASATYSPTISAFTMIRGIAPGVNVMGAKITVNSGSELRMSSRFATIQSFIELKGSSNNCTNCVFSGISDITVTENATLELGPGVTLNVSTGGGGKLRIGYAGKGGKLKAVLATAEAEYPIITGMSSWGGLEVDGANASNKGIVQMDGIKITNAFFLTGGLGTAEFKFISDFEIQSFRNVIMDPGGVSLVQRPYIDFVDCTGSNIVNASWSNIQFLNDVATGSGGRSIQSIATSCNSIPVITLTNTLGALNLGYNSLYEADSFNKFLW